MEPETSEVEPRKLPALPRRLVDVMFSPGHLFEALAYRPVWVGALLVGAVLVVIASLITAYGMPEHAWEDLISRQVRARGQEVPSNLETLVAITRLSTVIGGLAFWVVGAFILAGVLSLLFGFAMGDGARYGQYLSVVAHAAIISALGFLLTSPLRLAQGDPRLILSVGTFFGSSLGEGYLSRVLNVLDLFHLWSYLVIAVGVITLSKKRGWRGAAAVMMMLAVVRALLFGIPRS